MIDPHADMTDPVFYIVDVFAEGAYAGNQLAVLPEGQHFSGAEMQQIARAFNFAETTFICGGSAEQGYDVRIFTPDRELPFAGHPTLGTAWIIREKLGGPETELVLNLGVGPIPVSFAADGVAWMRQNSPQFIGQVEQAQVAELLGLEPAAFDAEFPIEIVSTGIPFVLVPLKDQAALRSIVVNNNGWRHFNDEGVLAFALPGYAAEQQLSARMFAGPLGVTEDPATGSANGCLAAWLCQHQYFGAGQIDICVGQGYEIGRPSQLYLSAESTDGDIEVRVGGRVQAVAEGRWQVPRQQ